MTPASDNELHEQRRALFRKAIQSKDLAAARDLLADGTLQNPPMGSAALIKAARADDAELVKLLLRAGANPNKIDTHGETPAYVAAVNGNPRALVALLDGGADPNRALTNPPILAAATNPSVLEILIERGAKLDVATETGATALHRAAMAGKTQSVRLLLDAGAPINAVNNSGGTRTTSLHEAARVNLPEIVSLFIEHGANLEMQDHLGRTAALIAAHDGHLDIFDALIAGGANPLARDSFHSGALEQALMSSLDDAAVDLVARHPDLAPAAEALDKTLAMAVRNGCLKATKMLVDMGADVGQKADGRPLIQCAPDDADELRRYLRAVKSGDLIASAMADPDDAPAATTGSHTGPVL